MTLDDILSIEGIVIRKIPKEQVSHWLSSDDMVKRHKAKGGETYINDKGREIMIERKVLSYGGKYLITFAFNQDSMVRYDLKSCGVGDTIELAYEDFHAKGGIVR